jgi:WD40 repeat protein
VRLPDEDAIVMLHSDSANTGFKLVTQMLIPNTKPIRDRWFFSPPAFSADGSKFAVAANDGTVSVWDVRNKIPVMVKGPNHDEGTVVSLKFSSGALGREILALMEVCQLCLDVIFFMLNKLLVVQEHYYLYSPH